MSPGADPLAAHALFLPGEPARFGRFALWGPGIEGGEPLGLFRVLGGQVRKVPTPVHYLSISQALPILRSDRHKSPSLACWSAAAGAGLGLIARGLIRPAVTETGIGEWRVEASGQPEAHLLDELAAALPPEGCAQPLPGAWPAVRVPEPAALIRQLWDALADSLPRERATQAAADGSAGHPFASWPAVKVRGAHRWPRQAEQARLVLSVLLPPDPSDDVVHGDGTGEHADGEDDTAVPAYCKLEPWVRSSTDPSLLIRVSTLWKAPPVVASRFGPEPEQAALSALRRAARLWPPLDGMLQSPDPGAMDLPGPLLDELIERSAELSASDIEVRVPAELAGEPLFPRAVAMPVPEPDTDPFFDLQRLVRLTWRPADGGEALTEEELEQLAAAKSSLVRLRGRWVRLDAATRQRLRARRSLTGGAALAAALEGGFEADGEWLEFEATGRLAELGARLAESATAAPLPVVTPATLKAVLRPYQERGLAWLAHLTQLGLGGCLADDMGLGKTVQVIALHLLRAAEAEPEGPTLVVCPTSLLGNWEREIRRFAPDTPVRRFHGGLRHLESVAADEFVLVTYGLLRNDTDDLARIRWGLIVADEAQNVKNPLAYTARRLRELPAAARIALTGTPVENRLTELWALMDWATPGLLGSLPDFQRELAGPIERDADPEATRRLSRLVRPFLLRRRKSDPGIAPELPPKTETDLVVPLTAEQASLYKAVADDGLARIQADPVNKRTLILRLLHELKQVCNHPAQYLHEPGPLAGRSGKLDALDDLLEVTTAEGESVLVFTQYVQMGRLIERHLAGQGISTLFLHGRSTDRDATVAAFQAGAAPVLLLSLKAGGVGLNLTRATHVVHYDRWWNPAVEDQASDRAHRIGQDRPVQIHRLVTEGTLEERIAAMLASKRALAETVIGVGEHWLSDMDAAQVAGLVRLGPGYAGAASGEQARDVGDRP
jgi:superfamily II DNA or RNA helicase